MTQSARKRRGSGRTTLHNVAELAGVSAMTVSRYFSNKESVRLDMQQRIAAAIEQTGYVRNVFAGSLASARGRCVGMVIPHIAGGVYEETIQAVTDTLRPFGYQLLLASSNYSTEEEEAAVRAFIGWAPAALILTGQKRSRKTTELLANAGVPVVETWAHKTRPQHIQVGFSNPSVGKDSTHYLYERGYRRIVFVHPPRTDDVGANDRASGYEAAMHELGLAPATFRPQATVLLDAGAEAFRTLTSGRTPADALIFSNDNLAAGALLHGLRERIAIAQTCAVMGFGDLSIADKLVPSLTTVRPPRYEMGRIAALRVIELLRAIEEDAPTDAIERDNLLTYEIVERESA
ncbi:LacI family DNA-binding transcriptional regulator [Paraburkholderia unamae]|uniref:LacI family transcriptional regulator n=1 Tax=Paraburkholderia unamae TaxID=219649 RepID=A0ABX5KPI6_9BURK|nr:LacI family DNA-binding transcriptional regulator [Paraburkholderia unamae]PVX83977.1 LacI family transcriptional regulator [Paraburkholderia unamae]CAG9265018.1 LacI family transcription regulator [Paraburkholderia unamae]